MIPELYPSGHFYSVIPDIDKNYHNRELKFIGLDFNDKSHLDILKEIKNYLFDFDDTFGHKNVAERQKEGKYTLMNGAFEWMDARMLYYFLQKNKPKKIIEIGSGNSTLLMCNTKKKFNLDVEIICIEPYPNHFLEGLHNEGHICLIKKKLEEVDLSIFTQLENNDILFIDSSHVVKLDSDVIFYFTKIFPLLKKNVLIHIHDIFFPYDYPLDWLKKGIYWNEQYFLFTFLQYNSKFKIKFCNSYSRYKYHDELKKIQKDSYEVKQNPSYIGFSGGSIWINVCE